VALVLVYLAFRRLKVTQLADIHSLRDEPPPAEEPRP
jgi:hypothetical protein